MIDYIETTKHCADKGKPFLAHLQLEAKYSSGWERYTLQGCCKFEVWYNPISQMLRLSGSILYFVQGHNFTYTPNLFAEGIRIIERLLQVGLWDSYVDVFEYGVIMQVNQKPADYITHHYSKPSEKLTVDEKGKDKGNFRMWKDSNVTNKMYDAGRNIKQKQPKAMQEKIMQEGWNPELDYLKWEAHYKKPEFLNGGKGLILADLMNPQCEAVIKEDVYLQYKRLIPMKTILIPSDKKDLSTAGLLAIVLGEISLNNEKTIQELKKMLYGRINAIPDDVLSVNDKKARQRQIKALLEKLKEAPESKWDLSKQLEDALLCQPSLM